MVRYQVDSKRMREPMAIRAEYIGYGLRGLTLVMGLLAAAATGAAAAKILLFMAGWDVHYGS